MKQGLFITAITGVLLCCGAGLATAAGQSYPLVTESQFFNVYADPEVDIEDLLTRMNFDYFYQLEMIGPKEEFLPSPREVLGKTLDGIFLEVCDTLGIGLYSFHGNLKIFPDQPALAAEYRELFGAEFSERSFYFHETNTLYVAASDLTVGIVVHEIAHVVMSHYFVVPPSPKLQEILSGYVEFHFRKALGIL